MAANMKDEMNYKKAKQIIDQNQMTFEQVFSIFTWLNQAEQVEGSQARDIVLRLLDKKESLPPPLIPILQGYIEKFGYFPYLTEDDEISLKMLLHREFYRSENIREIVMHQKQAEVFDRIENNQSVILSAPTSFGKSLLIQEIVASKKYNNIVIILPTLALIDETRHKLQRFADHYKLIFTSKQTLADKNILILTPERLIEIEELPKIDFFIIDEFYKLSGDRNEDDRLNVLNHAFYKLIKCTKSFYLLGPNISSIPAGFEDTYNAKFIPSDYATVSCDEHLIKRKKGQEFDQLLELLGELNEPTMIYCQSPAQAEKYTRQYIERMQSQLKQNNDHMDAINWISKNIHPDWSLSKAFSYGVAFHHGAMPRHLGRYIVEEFNSGKIRYLFCTSTLIEGINTTAKNVIVFDNKKGQRKITYFDYRNICGRAGRMTKHFVGRVFTFFNPPNDNDVHVDFPWYTQDQASDEILIQVEEKDLKPKSKEKLKPYKEQDLLDIEIIKGNNNISVSGQLALAERIQKDLDYYHEKLTWTNFPTYEQLKVCCQLIFEHLMYNKSRDRITSGNQLTYMVFNYVRLQSNAAEFIKFILKTDRDVNTPDQAVQKATNIIRSWFEFRFPKMLLALEQIQQSVFKLHDKSFGEYKYYASLIESGFCNPTLANLQEFGIPISLLRKIESSLGKIGDEDLDQIILRIKKLDVSKVRLDSFEKKILNDFIKS